MEDATKNEFHIENPEKYECPTCKSVYGITNGEETILRKITFVYMNKKTKKIAVKCKKCKTMIYLDE